MSNIFVYADFDWLKEIEPIGMLRHEMLRGSETYGFEYNPEWLKKHGSLLISSDINNYPGIQYTQQGKDIFGCFSDALPDRWGRTLMNRKEQIRASEENRAARRLSSFDYLVGIDDFSRIGGFRFKTDPEKDFINLSNNLRIPPLNHIRELIHASQEIENSESKNILPEEKWLNQLIQPGSSLGGARPKASVIDGNSVLHIAKFPSRNDDYDVCLWEHFCLQLAKLAGINTAQTRIIQTDYNYHALLSKRFDRSSEKRIHFASAMTLLGLSDGDNASSGHGYLDIVDFIVQSCTDVEYNLHELFRRVAFSICIGNSDDHFRNHGFLLTQKGWILAPAYDINPTLSEEQSLLISASSSTSSLNILLNACEEYMLSKATAYNIIEEVIAAVKDWRKVANKLGASKRDMSYFAPRFEKGVSSL